MNDSFGEYINLGMNCFSFSVNYLTQTLLDFKFLLTNILLLWWVYHYLWFDISTLQFSIFFLVLCTNVLTITGHGDFLWIGVPSSIFGDFLLFVNWMFPMPLAYTSAPSYKGDTKFLHIPFVFLQSFLYAFIWFFYYLFSSSEILSSTCSCLPEWLSKCFYSQDFNLVFITGFKSLY
jgi:hypothetical protein